MVANVWNTNDKDSSITLSNGDLTATKTTSSVWKTVRGLTPHSHGKWYFEVVIDTATDNNNIIGIAGQQTALSSYSGADAYSYGYNGNNGFKFNGGSSSAYGSTYTAGDVIGVAVDLDAGKIWWAKNNTWQASGDPAAGTGAAYTNVFGAFHPTYSPYQNNNAATGRFKTSDFSYTPPSGFSAWDDDYTKNFIWDANRKHADMAISASPNENQVKNSVGGSERLIYALEPVLEDVYFEIHCDQATGSSRMSFGISLSVSTTYNGGPSHSGGGIQYLTTGSKNVNGGSDTAFGASLATNDVIGVAIEFSTGKVWFSKNGTWQASGDPVTKSNPAGTINKSGVAYYPGLSATSINDGGRLRAALADFSYPVPSGFKSYAGEGSQAANGWATTLVRRALMESSHLRAALLQL